MKKQTFLILFLMTFAFAGVITFLDRASTYISKDAVDEEVVLELQESYIDYLYQTEVIKQSKEALVKSSPVTEAEIEAYRTYYGSMQEQIDNIKEQYEGGTKEELKVRDKKINDIRTNFKDDDVVRDKVAKLKGEAIEDYLRDVANDVQTFEKAQHFNFRIEIEGQTLQEKIGDTKSISELSRSYNAETILQGLNALHRTDEDIDLPFDVKLNHPKAFIQVELLQSIYKDSNFGDEIENFEWRKIAFYIVWLMTAIAIVYLVIERKKVKETFGEIANVKLPKVTNYIDVNIGIVFFGVWMTIILANGMANFVESIVYNVYYSNSLSDIISRLIEIIVLVVFTVGTLLVGTKLINQLRQSNFTKEQFVLSKVVHFMKEVFYNRSLGKQMLAALIVFACAGFGLAVVFMMPVAILLYIPLFIAIVIPTLIMFLRRFAYLSRIISHTEKLANGHLTEPLEAKGNSVISKHADNINALQTGVKQSMQAQARSERLKTELITNVSHDLRTPLTSIITYTDLLKADNLTDEERAKYVSILESKSLRLKTLIEDLFEVSKMATGNLNIERQQIDVAQLLQQIVAEHEEDFEQSGLALRMTVDEAPIYANADGQKLWRVYDNLLTNARKYSLANTRVYVSLKNELNEVVLTIKNVTKYELGENVEELTERFKRGDASRNTDGSGLGLAIAQSIVELHGGQMAIELHGDLFLVTVRLPK